MFFPSLEVFYAVFAISNGIICILITLAIEKLGGAIGGILGCIPSTLLIVVWSQWMKHSYLEPTVLFPFISELGFMKFQKILLSIPPGMLINSLYLYSWRVVPKLYAKRFPKWHLYRLLLFVFLTNISVWLCFSLSLIFFLENTIPNSPSSPHPSPDVVPFTKDLILIYCISFGTTSLAILIGLVTCWTPPSAPRGVLRTPWYIFFLRGLGTACTTGLGLYLSGKHQYIGGIISVFPVIFTTTMVSVWIHQGSAVSQGAIGPLMLGQTSSGLFVTLMAFLPTVLNFYVSMLLCFVLCVGGVNIPAYFYLQWRMQSKLQNEKLMPHPVSIAPSLKASVEEEHSKSNSKVEL